MSQHKRVEFADRSRNADLYRSFHGATREVHDGSFPRFDRRSVRLAKLKTTPVDVWYAISIADKPAGYEHDQVSMDGNVLSIRVELAFAPPQGQHYIVQSKYDISKGLKLLETPLRHARQRFHQRGKRDRGKWEASVAQSQFLGGRKRSEESA